jgi:hypothetical protein
MSEPEPGADPVSDPHRAPVTPINAPVTHTTDGVEDAAEGDEVGHGGADSV